IEDTEYDNGSGRDSTTDGIDASSSAGGDIGMSSPAVIVGVSSSSYGLYRRERSGISVRVGTGVPPSGVEGSLVGKWTCAVCSSSASIVVGAVGVKERLTEVD